MAEKIDQFKEELQSHGLRITNSRLAVFTILENSKKEFLSPDEIFEAIKQSKLKTCDRASVYRVLKSLEEIGLVNVSHFQGEASKYKIHLHNDDCHHCDDDHQHYFKCIKCKSVESIGDCLFEKQLKDLTKKGYVSLSHHFEVSGFCPKCN